MSSPDLEWIYRATEVVVLGAGVVMAIMRSGRLISRFESLAERQTAEISDLKLDVKELNKLVVETTKIHGSVAMIEERQVLAGKRLDELTGRFNRFLDESFNRFLDEKRPTRSGND